MPAELQSVDVLSSLATLRKGHRAAWHKPNYTWDMLFATSSLRIPCKKCTCGLF